MAIDLSKYTKQQIEAAEPLVKAWEKYERMIAAEETTNDVERIKSEPYEKMKSRRDKVANLRTKQKQISNQVADILNKRKEFEEKKKKATALVNELEEMQRTWFSD